MKAIKEKMGVEGEILTTSVKTTPRQIEELRSHLTRELKHRS